MKMENGSSAYLNGNGALKGTAGMVNAVSMESLDSVISATNGNASDSQAQVRTLFVSGLPVDVKPRELYLLFRAYSGYEASQLKLTPSGKNGAAAKSTPVGFVTFATRADAEEAIKKLEGVKFDPEQTPTIRLEFARSNTKVTKPSKQPSPPTHISPASMSLPAILQPPAPLVSAAHHHNMAVAQQLAAIQQQQQLAAAAVLLNQQQQHHDSAHGQQNGASPTSSLAQQQQLLAVLAAADQQRQQQQHITPLLAAAAAAGGSAGASGLDMQQHLAAALVNGGASSSSLAALSQQQQQNAALQQLLGHQQHGLILQGAGANPQLMAALAAAQQQQQLNSLQQSSVPNGQWAGTYAHHQQQQNGSGATSAPCSTIFVGNLGPAAVSTPTAVEDELRSLFGMFPGFSRIRMHAKSGAPVAFVEFSEVAQAVAAMQAMQGYVLGANGGGGGGGMRIEFAKTRMGDSQKTANEQQNGTTAK